MSILAEAVADVPPSVLSGADVLLLVVVGGLSIIGLMVAIRLRVYRSRSVLGPERLPPSDDIWPLGLGIAVAFVSFFGCWIGWAVYLGISQAGRGHAAPVASTLPPGPLLILSSVIPVSAMLLTMLAVTLARKSTLRSIGMSLASVPVGLRAGGVACLIVIPWMSLIEFLTEQIYNTIGLKHPSEHALLTSMRSVGPALRTAGILAAAIAAPFAEEFFFRGLVQTFLREAIARWWAGRTRSVSSLGSAPPTLHAAVPSADSVVAAPMLPEFGQVLGYAGLPFHPVEHALPRPATTGPGAAAWPAWAAIFLTSLAFASAHEAWTAPIIFVLSVMLGYVYERTGSLWTSIVVHAGFNILSTVYFLVSLSN